MSPTETRSAVAHLLRRGGLGSSAAEIDTLASLGYDGAVDWLCRLDAPDEAAEAIRSPSFDTAGYLARKDGDKEARREAAAQAREERIALVLWWTRRMAAAELPLREKLAFLWHDHFATSLAKVKLPELMYDQYRTLYQFGPGPFDELVGAMARDPAMLIWLDGRTSTGRTPNENFARELFELFTLGLHGPGHAGEQDDGHATNQPYTESDIADAARSLTGWVIDRGGKGVLNARRHDSGTKTVLGVTGNLGLDEVVQAATDHPSCAPHVVARLWSRLARPAQIDDPVVIELAATFAEDLDVGALVRRIFLHPEFLAPASRTALVKTPVEYVVGTARALGLALDERVLSVLRGLGQIPFIPPDVAGWPANEAWLSTSASMARLQFATDVAATTEVSSIADAASTDRPDAVARVLGVDRWGDATARALRNAASDPPAVLTVALMAPEYLLA